MAPSSKILLVLGAGKNIGLHVAAGFKAQGYKVAVVSRSANHKETTPEGYLALRADLSDPKFIPGLFDDIKEEFGGPPNVVVFNAASLTPPEDPANPFSVPLDAFQNDLALMNFSPYVAAGEAVKGFETLGADAPKAFIYTGNLLAAVIQPVPFITTLGSGKSAASFWVGLAAGFFKDKDFRFYFADERKINGDSVSLEELSGPAAAKFYLELAEGDGKLPWHVTYVNGKGHVPFPDSTRK